MLKVSENPRARLLGEAIAGASLYSLASSVGKMLMALPIYQDAATRKAGSAIYDDVRRDAVVKGNLSDLCSLIMQEGVRWECAVPAPKPAIAGGKPDPKEQARYDLALRYRDELEAEFKGMSRPLNAVVKEMLRGEMIYGAKVAEIVRGSNWKITRIKPKKRSHVNCVVDQYSNLVGFVPATTTVGSSVKNDEVLPREKFLLFTHEQEDEEPLGRSLLESVYDWWYIKKHVLPAFLKYIVQFGVPSIVGIAAEGDAEDPKYDDDGNEVTDDDGNPITQSSLEALYQELLKFQGGSVAALPHGSDIKTLFAGGDGKAFIDGLRYLVDTQITYAMLGQARATMESRNSSKADSAGGKDILDVIVQGYQDQAADDLTEQLSRPWVALHYGEEAKELAPRAVLASPAKEDVGKVATAFATLHNAGAIAPEQYHWWDDLIGHGRRDMAAWQAQRSQAEEDRRLAVREKSRAAEILDEDEE